MSSFVESLARPAILKLAAYKSARSLATKGEIFLDANESPWLPYDGAPKRVNRYPEPQPGKLVTALSALYGVRPETILAGRGADDAIDTLVRTFCEAERDGILILPPTYGMYEVAAGIQGARIEKIPVDARNEFRVDADTVIAAWRPGLKLVFLCSPNNPTGNVIPAPTVEAICRGLLGRAIVVLDEAYVEFADVASMASRLEDLPNLVVLRTLSKAWALAGARCGVALGNPALIALLQKVRAPYPLSSPATEVVLQALAEPGIARERIARTKAERERLARALAELPAIDRVFPSEANFLLFRATEPAKLLEASRAAGIVLRDRGHEAGLAGCIRVSVGTEAENDRLLEVLRGL